MIPAAARAWLLLVGLFGTLLVGWAVADRLWQARAWRREDRLRAQVAAQDAAARALLLVEQRLEPVVHTPLRVVRQARQ